MAMGDSYVYVIQKKRGIIFLKALFVEMGKKEEIFYEDEDETEEKSSD